jgi:predicted ABC-type ATPase
MRQAKAAGYFVVLYFVGVEDHAISVARVADRVGKGGHNVPTAKIRPRYENSMRLLADAADTADRVYVFDNSGMGKERRLCAALDEKGLRAFSDPMPAWVRRYFVKPMEARKHRRPLRSRPHGG